MNATQEGEMLRRQEETERLYQCVECGKPVPTSKILFGTCKDCRPQLTPRDRGYD